MYRRKSFRTVVFYRHYFENFYNQQNKRVKKKILWTLNIIEEFERIPEIFLKHI